MKITIIAFLLFFFSSEIMFAQSEDSEQNVAVVTRVDSLNTYTFNHEVEYFEAFEDRLLVELNSNGEEVVESLSIANALCEIRFKENVPQDIHEEKLAILTRKMNFVDFRIK